MSKAADAMRKLEEAPEQSADERLTLARPARAEGELGAQLMESGEFAIVALDLDGRVTDWSRGATRLFGYSEAEATGLESSSLLANDETQNGVAESVILAALRDGRSEIEGWCVGKNGRRFWGSGVLSLTGPAGRQRFLLVLRDRTDQKLSEAEIVEESRSRGEALALLNALLVHAPVGFAFLDRSMRTIRVNDQFARMLGGADTPAGAPFEIAPVHASQIAELVRIVFTTGEQVENVEIEDRAHLREGARLHYLVSCYPVQDARSGWIAWVGVTAIDISRQKRTEQALAGALHTQKVIAREASHRVKNSLQLVASMLTMQARSARGEDVKAAVADARARIMTVAKVHDRLWRDIDIGIVELREYLSDLFGDLAQSAPGVRLAHDVEELSLAADQAIPLALMTSELLTNAFKYACPGGVGDVRVTVRRCAERTLRVVVEDRGPGLPEGFDPMGESGSLGMRMIQGFVRQLNGSLRHASAAPGARFEIDVPLQLPD